MLRSLVHNRDIIAANYNELEKNKILASKNSMTSSFHNYTQIKTNFFVLYNFCVIAQEFLFLFF